jgi:hypothetical protein
MMSAIRNAEESRPGIKSGHRSALSPVGGGGGVVGPGEGNGMQGRRRRSQAALWSAVAAVLAIGGVTAAVGLIRLKGDDPEPPAARPTVVTPARRADQITLDIDPTAGFVATLRGTDATRQFLTARNFADGGRYGGEVSAYDPGSFDAAPLQGAQVVDVSGKDAQYVPAYSFASLSAQDAAVQSPAIGWQDPSGIWLLVYAGPGEKPTRDDLIGLAESVTLAPARDLRAPFRLGTPPDGLAVTYVRSDEEGADRGGMAGLSDPRRKASSAAIYDGAPYGVTVAIAASPRDAEWNAEKPSLSGRRSTVAGHPAWYSEGKNMLSPEGNGSTLVVETDSCVLRLRTADRTAINRAELNRVVEQMTIGDCGDPDTWITPLA